MKEVGLDGIHGFGHVPVSAHVSAHEIANLDRLHASSRTGFQLLRSQQDDAEYVTWLILERHSVGGTGTDALAEEPLRFRCRRERLEAGLAGRLIVTHDSVNIGNILLVHRKYYNSEGGYYDNNTVTANLIALWYGLVPEEEQQRVFSSLVEKTENEFGGHVSSGVIGIQVLMRTLTEFGRPDLAFRIASDDTYPSWGYMAANGATTIWELWNGNTADPAMNSGNHVMLLGDLIIWEYEYLAGIRPLKPGFAEIELRPYPVEGLDYVDCSYESVQGRISSSWKKENGVFKWDVSVPKGIRTEVYLPGTTTPEIITGGKHHYEVRM